jgi:hypothetical protein
LLSRGEPLFQVREALHGLRFEGLGVLVEPSLLFTFVLVLGELASGRADPLIHRIDLAAGRHHADVGDRTRLPGGRLGGAGLRTVAGEGEDQPEQPDAAGQQSAEHGVLALPGGEVLQHVLRQALRQAAQGLEGLLRRSHGASPRRIT